MSQAHRNNPKVLIVDDDVLDRCFLDSLIKENFKDAELVHARNKEEAIEIIRKENFDAYIMDHKLEEHDTVDLIEEVGEHKPILFMTPKHSPGVFKNLMNKGAHKVLEKDSFHEEGLLNFVRDSVS